MRVSSVEMSEFCIFLSQNRSEENKSIVSLTTEAIILLNDNPVQFVQLCDAGL